MRVTCWKDHVPQEVAAFGNRNPPVPLHFVYPLMEVSGFQFVVHQTSGNSSWLHFALQPGRSRWLLFLMALPRH